MNVYSAEITVCATAYVVAGSAAEALEHFKAMHLSALEVRDDGGEVTISGAKFQDLPAGVASLSPAMTIYADKLTERDLTEIEEVDGVDG